MKHHIIVPQFQRFGLIGYPLGHSYSKSFFEQKFKKLNLSNYLYQLFEMQHLDEFPYIWSKYKDLQGVNITIPHKERILSLIDQISPEVKRIGAANVIIKRNEKLYGHNTDYFAFKTSLQKWIGDFQSKALILGSGGAAKAVKIALEDLSISYSIVSRDPSNGTYSYQELNKNPQIISQHLLIIQTTPLGMYPNNWTFPDIPYSKLTSNHWLYDLVYNPQTTTFMKKGKAYGTQIKNGQEMLKLQAEKSWEIWKK